MRRRLANIPIGLNIASMIDVVFLLLIFFICTASFQIVEQNLPSQIQIEDTAGTTAVPQDAEQQDLEPVILKIGWQQGAPNWEISGESCSSWDELRRRLAAVAAIDPSVPVILDVAPEVPLGNVIEAYDLGRATGFSQIQFAANVGA